jgi:rubrerythrin
MDRSTCPRSPIARRRLLQAAGAALTGAACAALTACGSSGQATGPGAVGTTTELEPQGTAGSRDVSILNSSLDLENMAIAAYQAAAPLLQGSARAAVARLLEQEREHADALAQAIRQLGGAPNEPKARYDFPRLRGQGGALRFAVGLENTAIAAYIDSLPRLSSPDLRGTAAAIVTDEAEHLAVLLGEQGRPQAPQAFVTGAM